MEKFFVFAAAAALTATATLSQAATVINLDFGPTDVTGSTTLAPYQAISGDSTNVTWNALLGTADKGAGTLKFGNNTTATNVTYNLGVTSATSSDSLLATQPSDSSALGTTYNTGIYANNSPAKDAIFDRNGGSNNRGIAMQVGGLTAGTWDIYYVGRNTSLDVSKSASPQLYIETLRAAASSSSGDFSFGSYASDAITYNLANTQTANWIDGGTYAKLSVTLTTGQYLNLAFTGSDVEKRGFLNALQIVSAPEPSAAWLLGSGVVLLARRRRK